ncbi:hypothetical protein B0H34DRAFT_682106 [Crassisporium funariophilum]|nr:hypothetical protein B0H34DRAFT_734620 [Crassisporium funariophilum]KAF8152423.1 hypothetical protein B0H34DRAFT_725348 [Crassisporium funariophilum]KAF8152436.1 hypothetical protein B0H34DRAFT_725506 [Crassisporium funariophilum]KAF8156971.1 hypothetical protein B0H34DRAFT_711412 [Crassisporium funariophilum]KAF8159968.1 hypothetical protein B0H34DRAFT_705579 [Crassisporium funariophilum]
MLSWNWRGGPLDIRLSARDLTKIGTSIARPTAAACPTTIRTNFSSSCNADCIHF